MPGLTLAPPAASATPPAPGRCRVFVSYAHQDALPPGGQTQEHSLLGRFEVELTNLLQTLEASDCHLDAYEVFIDHQRLNVEPAWTPAIERALSECELLVFLVSPDSVTSSFCVDKELRPVAARGGLIVPLLLRETANWHLLPLGNGLRLGQCHSGGLPRGAKKTALAIGDEAWGKGPAGADRAWAAATRDLTEFIGVHLFGRAGVGQAAVQAGTGTRGGATAVPAPIGLPVAYFCDQLHVTDDFDLGFNRHLSRHAAGMPHALLAIVQGVYLDAPFRLADRLHRYHLAARLRMLGVAPAQRLVPMTWPTDRPFDRTFPGRSVLKQLCEAIDPRLPFELDRCRNAKEAAALIDAHFDQVSAPPAAVFASLPDRDRVPVAATAGALENLVRCLDQCANAKGQMAKLVVYCIDEKADAPDYWAKTLPRTRRLALLALQPLKPVDEYELRQWHTKYELDHRWAWHECLELFNSTVAKKSSDGKRLRLYQWAEAVQQDRPDIAQFTPSLPAAAP